MAINLRKEAKDRECQVRIPNVCNKNPETVVLAHLNCKRLFGVGVGQKVPDIFGAWACSACHAVLDGRGQVELGPPEELLLLHMEGVFRTMKILLDEGKI